VGRQAFGCPAKALSPERPFEVKEVKGAEFFYSITPFPSRDFRGMAKPSMGQWLLKYGRNSSRQRVFGF